MSRIPPSPLTLWTYYELGLDLGGRPEKKRKELLSSMIGSLAWPKGSIFFWPCSALQGDSLVLRKNIFWEGIGKIRPHYCVLFGGELLQALVPDAPKRFGFFTRNGRKMLSLPSLSEMLPDNKPMKKIAWEFLKGLPEME
ncbi:MAG: hypothetical protein ACOC0U_03995 [Desulfovibrionales bacterium]